MRTVTVRFGPSPRLPDCAPVPTSAHQCHACHASQIPRLNDDDDDDDDDDDGRARSTRVEAYTARPPPQRSLKTKTQPPAGWRKMLIIIHVQAMIMITMK